MEGISAQTTVYLLMSVIYVIVLYIFERARRKFKGGTIEKVIRLIIINTVLLLLADYINLLGFLGADLTYILQTVLRLAAMCAIAFGGVRLIVD